MSDETIHTNKLLAKYKKIVSNFKKISKLIAIDRALDISNVSLDFNIFHVIDYSFVVYYILSTIYITFTKFDNKMDILRPVTLCPLAVQV